ncbi:hypothetical protein H6G41_30440 [Tolypothrix sp. FACHB-123]|nr:hypothetical protein [Tolypothrix sp. FACHB-123]
MGVIITLKNKKQVSEIVSLKVIDRKYPVMEESLLKTNHIVDSRTQLLIKYFTIRGYAIQVYCQEESSGSS